MRPRQNGRHFTDDIFKCIFLNENVWIPIEISMTFVPKGPINIIPALVQIMAWRRPGDKPLSEPMMVSLTTHICVIRPQWVNSHTQVDIGIRDTVPDERLLGKLASCGIHGPKNYWIRAVLMGRTMSAVVGGESSDPAQDLSCVPQGIVLGPLFFLIYINDMPSQVGFYRHIHAHVRWWLCSISWNTQGTGSRNITVQFVETPTIGAWDLTQQMLYNAYQSGSALC